MFRTEYVSDFVEFYTAHKEHIEKHYEDFSETFGGSKKVNIDIPLYQHLIDLGHANIFTLWEDSTFLGYVSVTITPSVLFKGEIDSIIDHFYLTEDARGKGYAQLVVKEIENQLVSDGVSHVSLALPALEKYEGFADKLGFTKQSCVYNKMLGDHNGS